MNDLNQDYTIQVRITDIDIGPEKIRSRDVGPLIVAIEEMLAVLISRENPELGIESSQVVIGLADVKRGSYVLDFKTQFPQEAQRAYRIVANAVNENDYAYLPPKAIKGLESVRDFARRYNGVAEFWDRNGHGDSYRKLTSISTTTKIDAQITFLKSRTTLYGKVFRVGGEDKPTARIRILSGQVINCTLRNEKIAQELGSRLYKRVGLQGIALYDPTNMVLEHFNVENILDYDAKSLTESFSSLYEVVGEYLDPVENLDEIFAGIRYDDDEDEEWQ